MTSGSSSTKKKASSSASTTQTTSSTTQTTSSSSSYTGQTLAGIGNLIKLLPTGTVFLFQFLDPVTTNNGDCSNDSLYKYLTAALIALCGLSCFLVSFTDSYTTADGATHYGFATLKGLWPSPEDTSDSTAPDLKPYRLRVGDFAHALLSVAVFGVVSLLDANTVGCLYPSFQNSQKTLMMVVPPVIGAVAGVVFAIFPSVRHGIGYPSTTSSTSSSRDQSTNTNASGNS